mmetsp:Transcript_105034/g.292550  ORF Transcript_105034/g.292550 Transcript_105034/m.292550 type:complete len:229 (+) Transcript_105034:529-1215(+)
MTKMVRCSVPLGLKSRQVLQPEGTGHAGGSMCLVFRGPRCSVDPGRVGEEDDRAGLIEAGGASVDASGLDPRRCSGSEVLSRDFRGEDSASACRCSASPPARPLPAEPGGEGSSSCVCGGGRGASGGDVATAPASCAPAVSRSPRSRSRRLRRFWSLWFSSTSSSTKPRSSGASSASKRCSLSGCGDGTDGCGAPSPPARLPGRLAAAMMGVCARGGGPTDHQPAGGP